MVEELDRVRQREHRTRSELLREALRHYMAKAGTGRAIPVEDAQPDVTEAVRVAEEEYARGQTVRLEDPRQDAAPRHPEIDAALAPALEDVRAGRLTPAFSSMEEYNAWRRTPEGKKFARS